LQVDIRSPLLHIHRNPRHKLYPTLLQCSYTLHTSPYIHQPPSNIRLRHNPIPRIHHLILLDILRHLLARPTPLQPLPIPAQAHPTKPIPHKIPPNPKLNHPIIRPLPAAGLLPSRPIPVALSLATTPLVEPVVLLAVRGALPVAKLHELGTPLLSHPVVRLHAVALLARSAADFVGVAAFDAALSGWIVPAAAGGALPFSDAQLIGVVGERCLGCVLLEWLMMY
jgi:hypothetical protein